mmetsp:Transcript_104824/g.318029  ORF Transcript_104824/g.318029 Transcript_104824/m.318029 type:complete len:395 (+) Transcript_104824:223-1407(+)
MCSASSRRASRTSSAARRAASRLLARLSASAASSSSAAPMRTESSWSRRRSSWRTRAKAASRATSSLSMRDVSARASTCRAMQRSVSARSTTSCCSNMASATMRWRSGSTASSALPAAQRRSSSSTRAACSSWASRRASRPAWRSCLRPGKPCGTVAGGDSRGNGSSPPLARRRSRSSWQCCSCRPSKSSASSRSQGRARLWTRERAICCPRFPAICSLPAANSAMQRGTEASAAAWHSGNASPDNSRQTWQSAEEPCTRRPARAAWGSCSSKPPPGSSAATCIPNDRNTCRTPRLPRKRSRDQPGSSTDLRFSRNSAATSAAVMARCLSPSPAAMACSSDLGHSSAQEVQESTPRQRPAPSSARPTSATPTAPPAPGLSQASSSCCSSRSRSS